MNIEFDEGKTLARSEGFLLALYIVVWTLDSG